MSSERLARLLVLSALLALPGVILAVRWSGRGTPAVRTIEIRGRMPEDGGWSPSDLSVAVGEPLRLRLISDDVMHGFAVGRLDLPALEMKPGHVSETTISFERPGRYVFYCTRWCGPNHWRMRGTIEVTGDGEAADGPAQPLFLKLGLDLDAPHLADVLPARPPSAARAVDLGVTPAGRFLSLDDYRRQSPAQTWHALRSHPVLADLTDMQVWDLVAWVWEANTTAGALREGAALYRANCAACHGEAGRGDGVMAAALAGDTLAGFGHSTKSPADFGEPQSMLGASPALLCCKARSFAGAWGRGCLTGVRSSRRNRAGRSSTTCTHSSSSGARRKRVLSRQGAFMGPSTRL